MNQVNKNNQSNLHSENFERLVRLIKEHSDIIDLSTERKHALRSWFKAYQSSKEHAELSPEKREQALEVFLDLHFLLKELNDIICGGLPDTSTEN